MYATNLTKIKTEKEN